MVGPNKLLHIALGAALCLNASASGEQAVNFRAADGVKVYGELYATGEASGPIVLLFHQADYNKDEYAEIVPRLVEAGLNALTVDQRSGGNSYGGQNFTVDALGRSTAYLDALPDLEAAVAWAEAEGYETIVVWGSSYSASLVFLLAAKTLEIAGVVSFSPGEYFADAGLVREAAAEVTVPVFITSDDTQSEADEAHAIFEVVAFPDKVEFVPDGIGFHGLLALVQGSLQDAYWAAVLAFLERLRGRPEPQRLTRGEGVGAVRKAAVKTSRSAKARGPNAPVTRRAR